MPLRPLPDHHETVIVVGTTVRKALPVLSAFLQSLSWQELPPRVRLVPAFVPDFTPEQSDARDLLFTWVNERNGVLIQGQPSNPGDFSDAAGLDSHQWGVGSMQRVGQNKNAIFAYALSIKADYVFLADADLILDRTTIASLLSTDRPIATAVYWTRWSKASTETRKIMAAPQVWLRHPYELSGRGMDEAEFRTKLLSRGITRVWGFGACTLIRRNVLEAGVSFDYLAEAPTDGLMAGEDRHFSMRAERLHIDAWADSWPDIFHIYHAPEDVDKIPEMMARLGAPHPSRARVGDLVSLRIRALEAVPVGPGRAALPPPLMLRGRLGQLALLPEIEDAVLSTDRGEKRTVRCHFPTHYPTPFLRGRVRLMEISVLDVKPFGAQPVVEEDLFLRPGTAQDLRLLNDGQQASVAEAAVVQPKIGLPSIVARVDAPAPTRPPRKRRRKGPTNG